MNIDILSFQKVPNTQNSLPGPSMDGLAKAAQLGTWLPCSPGCPGTGKHGGWQPDSPAPGCHRGEELVGFSSNLFEPRGVVFRMKRIPPNCTVNGSIGGLNICSGSWNLMYKVLTCNHTFTPLAGKKKPCVFGFSCFISPCNSKVWD